MVSPTATTTCFQAFSPTQHCPLFATAGNSTTGRGKCLRACLLSSLNVLLTIHTCSPQERQQATQHYSTCSIQDALLNTRCLLGSRWNFPNTDPGSLIVRPHNCIQLLHILGSILGQPGSTGFVLCIQLGKRFPPTTLTTPIIFADIRFLYAFARTTLSVHRITPSCPAGAIWFAMAAARVEACESHTPAQTSELALLSQGKKPRHGITLGAAIVL